MDKMDKIEKMFKMGIIFVFILGFATVFFNLSPVAFVKAGERGVLLEWGAVSDVVLNEGIHFKIPLYQEVEMMDVRTQKLDSEAISASADLQDVHTTVVVNYHLDPLSVNTVYQTLRKDYESKIILPAIQEAVKASTARFNAEELITKRPVVKEDIKEVLTTKLITYNIIVEDISITNFQFSPAFAQAIENKQVAEQEALKAQRVIVQREAEAKQAIAQAEGEKQAKILRAEGNAQEILLVAEARAEELRLQRQEITPELNKFNAIKKWDGVMPTYIGGGIVPFIELDTNAVSSEPVASEPDA